MNKSFMGEYLYFVRGVCVMIPKNVDNINK